MFYAERLDSLGAEMARYRVALGIDKASQGALIELNNQELYMKAQSIVLPLRRLADELDRRERIIQKELESKRISKDEAIKQQTAAAQQIAITYDQNLASDAYNVRNEIRKRLSPEAIAHIVRVPAFPAADGASIPLMEIMKGEYMTAFFIRGFADEIEGMAKLLPNAG